MKETKPVVEYDPSIANPDQLPFKDFISEKIKAVNSVNGFRHITTSELAETFGMSKKVLLEILNGRRGDSDRRDFIIALCAELGLDAVETNEALHLFPGFLRRLSMDDPRDRAITEFLNAGFDVDISYASLNQMLAEHHYPPLKIKYRNPAPNEERRTSVNDRKIDWNLRTGEERQRYNYYTSLGYDNETASVLALFTYGDRDIIDFSISQMYDYYLSRDRKNREKQKSEVTCKMQKSLSYQIEEREISYSPHRAYHEFDSLADEVDLYIPTAPTAVHNEFEELTDGSDVCFKEETAPAPPVSAPKSRDEIRFKRGIRFKLDLNDVDVGPSMPSVSGAPFAPPATDEYDAIEERNAREADFSSHSTFRMTTNTASAGILLNQLRAGRPISKDMVRIEELMNYYRYETEKPKKELFRISTELKDRESGSKMLYINVQAKEEVKKGQNIVILLDVSGSMSSENVQTQATVATIVSKLRAGDTFSLVTYSNYDHVILDGTVISSDEDKVHVLEKLLGLKIMGGTYGSAGIEKAYQIGKRHFISGGNNQVILITDGDLNFGITSKGGLENLIEEKKKSNLFLSVIGTGLTNYKDNKLETLSKHGNGVYRVINNLSDVKKSIRDEYVSLVNVIAKDVKAQVEFNPELVKSYRLLGFENREISRENFTDDTVISEPFGSGGYGIALYELEMRQEPEKSFSVSRYSTVQTTGSTELGIVRIRYKEPLEETSHEIEYVISSAEEHYSDNLILAQIVYTCAEKLRDSDKIDGRDEALALAAIDNLGSSIKLLNYDDIGKLREILRRSKSELHVSTSSSFDEDIW